MALTTNRHLLAPLALVLVAGTAAPVLAQSNVPRYPNSRKYSDTGARPATGRSGSAVVETRAMLARNMTMVVEASTGALEAGAGPGQIVKAQLKIGDRTQNFNGLTGGGYWSASVPGVARATSVQVQTNVRGIDPRRTDVVTVATPAVLRPDVAVRSVTGAPESRPQMPVHFYATVAELNGDLGARANCVLSVNDVVVDSADGIWVDAGDVVTCEFTHVFDTAGTYAVKVSATGVAPGDWDGANNSAATSITVLNPDRTIRNGYMAAFVNRYFNDSVSGRYGCVVDGYSCDFEQRYGSRYLWSNLQAGGWTQGMSAPVDRLEVQAYLNGMIQHKASLVPMHSAGFSDPNTGYTSTCVSYQYEFQNKDGSWIYSADRFSMCVSGYKSAPHLGTTRYEYQRIEGRSSYFSSYRWCQGGECGGWSSNYTQYTYGSGADLGWKSGAVVGIKLSFVDQAGIRHTMDRSVTLEGPPPSDVTTSSSETDQLGTYFRYQRSYGESASVVRFFNDSQ